MLNRLGEELHEVGNAAVYRRLRGGAGKELIPPLGNRRLGDLVELEMAKVREQVDSRHLFVPR